MSKSNNLGDFLTGIADAIRAKTGSSALIDPQDFDTEIANLPTGGGSQIELNQNGRTFTSYRKYDSQGTQFINYEKLTLSDIKDIPIKNAYVFDWATETFIPLQDGSYKIYATTSYAEANSNGDFTIGTDAGSQRFFRLNNFNYISSYTNNFFVKSSDNSFAGALIIQVDESKIIMSQAYGLGTLVLVLSKATKVSGTYQIYGQPQPTTVTAQSAINISSGLYMFNISRSPNPSDSNEYTLTASLGVVNFYA